MTEEHRWVWLARIRRPQGRKGEVFAEILTDFPEKFAERKRLWLVNPSAPEVGLREMELFGYWPHKGGMVLHFSGVDSIAAAEAISGLLVAIPHTERAQLGEDEAYISDLIGCTLFDVSGVRAAGAQPAVVGRIEDVDRSGGPVALLVVRRGAQEVLVPFAKSYLRRMDLDAKQIEMELPEGLVDLNAPGGHPADS